jgi:translation elongation factor EF-Ts
MPENKVIGCLFVCALLVAAFNPLALGQEKIEGKVIKTNLTSCSVVPGKVGTCEGTLVLENMKDGKPDQMTVKVTRDTMLKKGNEKVFLFQLQGAPVTVTFSEDKAQKVARSVVTKDR